MSGRHVAIVGAGQAAARVVSALRGAGFDGAITLIGDEQELPYERPPLSKQALFDAQDVTLAPIHALGDYAAHGVALVLGEHVEVLDVPSRTLRLASGRAIQADRIVIATGARARRPQWQGVDPQQVLTLRSMADARHLRAKLAAGRRVVMVGGGFIGLEIAAGAARMNCDVTVIEARPRLLERAVSPHVSALVNALHLSHGVKTRLGHQVVDVRQRPDGIELQLDDGSVCIADVLVAGIGAEPNDELARAAGLQCGNGIEVDAQCRTSAPGIWAVGDVAARHHPSWGRRVRLESWDNAEVHAAIAGRSIAASWNDGAACTGAPDPADAPAWFWTEQYELNLQILGDVADADHSVIRTEAKSAASQVFHFRAGAMTGVELINSGRERPLVKKLLQRGVPVDLARLSDGAVPLKELVAAARATGSAPPRSATP